MEPLQRNRPERFLFGANDSSPLSGSGRARENKKRAAEPQRFRGMKNSVTFPPRSGGKVLAALAERLAMQGVRGIRSHSRRAAAPSSSPANTRADSSEQRFFDKLKGGPGPPFTRPNKAHPLFREFISAAKAG